MSVIFWLEHLKGRHNLKEASVVGIVIVDWIRWKKCGSLWTGCFWLRIGTSG